MHQKLSRRPSAISARRAGAKRSWHQARLRSHASPRGNGTHDGLGPTCGRAGGPWIVAACIKIIEVCRGKLSFFAARPRWQYLLAGRKESCRGHPNMKLAFYLPCYWPDTHLPVHQMYDEMVEQAVLAEQIGMSSFWIPEHHFVNLLVHPSPLLSAVRVAAATKSIRIGTSVLVLPFYDMRRLAGEIAQADQLMKGRLEIGVGRGAFKYEFDRLGVAVAESRERFDEALPLLERLLTERNVSSGHALPTGSTRSRSRRVPTRSRCRRSGSQPCSRRRSITARARVTTSLPRRCALPSRRPSARPRPFTRAARRRHRHGGRASRCCAWALPAEPRRNRREGRNGGRQRPAASQPCAPATER